MEPSFSSEHFILHAFDDGVYAAIATEQGAGFSNTGLIDLGDSTLVFDAFENPQASQDLLLACRQLTGRAPAVTITSHFHPDHWGGLQVFAGSTILATHATRQAMLPLADEMRQDQQDTSMMESELCQAEVSLAAETDIHKRQTLQISIARQRHSLQALSFLEPTLPNQTFEGKLIFYGSQRSVELIDLGKAHTLSDCLLRLPQDRLAFIGDIGFFQSQPFMAYGFPAEWLMILDEMMTWELDTFVPGHGPVGSKTDLALEARYIRVIEDLVRRVVQSGGTLDDALRETLPAPFDAWQVVGWRFESNVRASFRQQSKP
jgi:glyoxylase-like metal-dependent hydrolase (beta-lactamase superfamily II)